MRQPQRKIQGKPKGAYICIKIYESESTDTYDSHDEQPMKTKDDKAMTAFEDAELFPPKQNGKIYHVNAFPIQSGSILIKLHSKILFCDPQ